MKDQALIKNKYVDFFYEQVDIEDELSDELKKMKKEYYLTDLLGIDPIKSFQGLIMNKSFDLNKSFLVTIGNFDDIEWDSVHVGIYKTANKIMNYESKLGNPHQEMGISFLLGKDSENTNKLIAFLDKPSRTRNRFESEDCIFRTCYKQIFENWGVDAVYLLKTDKEVSVGQMIYPKNASKMISLYTLEVVL